MGQPITNNVGVWSSEPQPSCIGSDSQETVPWVVGSFHAQRQPAFDCSSPSVQLWFHLTSFQFLQLRLRYVTPSLFFCFCPWLGHGISCCSVTPTNIACQIHSHAFIASHWCIVVGGKYCTIPKISSLPCTCVCAVFRVYALLQRWDRGWLY